MKAHILIASLVLLAAAFLFTLTTPILAQDREKSWWDRVEAEAQEHGYKLLTTSELHQIYQQKQDWLLIDTRYDYEYAQGSISGAVNFPFNPSHERDLPQEKQDAFQEMLGPDEKKKVILFCRNFR